MHLFSKSSTIKGLLSRRLKISLRSIVARKVHTIAWAKGEQESCHLTSNNQPLFTSWKFLWWFHTWAILRRLANARKCQLEDFCEKERYESCSVQRTFTADAFCRRQKRENSTVVMLLPDSHERLAFEKPTHSVPETWGRMYNVLALKKLVSSNLVKILKVATKIRETWEKTLFTPSSPVKATKLYRFCLSDEMLPKLPTNV